MAEVRYARIYGEHRINLRRKAVALYQEGLGIRDISLILGRSYGWTRVLLLESKGFVPRERGGDRTSPAYMAKMEELRAKYIAANPPEDF